MVKLIEILYVAAIVIMGAISARTEANIPFKMNMCVTRPDGSQVSMEIWSDLAERYVFHYPGSTCGKCGHPVKCPNEK